MGDRLELGSGLHFTEREVHERERDHMYRLFFFSFYFILFFKFFLIGGVVN